ncbi:MAG: SOS response-associated peptidase [Bacteriovoracia bacterium]
MCGRYALFTIDLLPKNLSWTPRYNIAPSQKAPVISKNGIALMDWGFSSHSKWIINARAETVEEKAMFKKHFLSDRRCVIPANGFFEWSQTGKKKQAYWITPPNSEELFYFAGIYNELSQFIILTIPAVSPIHSIHHRMPLIFRSQEEQARWFSSGYDAHRIILSHLKNNEQHQQSDLVAKQILDTVNNPTNDCPEILTVQTATLLEEPSPQYPDGNIQGELF